MHKLYLALVFVCIFFGSVFVGQNVGALTGGIVIYQVQAGGTSSSPEGATTKAATREFISIYNNTAYIKDITNWCISTNTKTKLVCFSPPSEDVSLLLPSYSYVTISSDNFAIDHHYEPDFIYTTTNNSSGSIVASNDTITLVDASGAIKDSITWPEPPDDDDTSLGGGYYYYRNNEPEPSVNLVDTDSINDFTKKTILNDITNI